MMTSTTTTTTTGMALAIKPLSPQADIILHYLKSGRELTPLIAHITLGIASLTSRMSELNAMRGDDGKHLYRIDSEWRTDGFERRYKAYWMVMSGG